MNQKIDRQIIWNEVQPATLCAVTKNHSIKEVEALLSDLPNLKCIAENRWPDCEEKFLKFQTLERHFIGPIQSNKVRKIIPLVDVIQSVDSLKLLQKINKTASKFQKIVKFCFQVNISEDPKKHGIKSENLPELIKSYQKANLQNVELIGLMTIGRQTNFQERRRYFKKFKSLFDRINKVFFPHKPLQLLSMGMSQDYKIAIEEGATMVRLGSILFTESSK